MFFDFWLGSYFLDLQPNFLLFLGLGCFFSIYLDMNFFSKLFADLEISRCEGQNQNWGG